MNAAVPSSGSPPDLANVLRDVWFGSAFYRPFLRARAPQAFFAVAVDPWPGDPAKGEALLAGSFTAHGRSAPLTTEDGAPPWRRPDADPLWLAELNRFEWLRDLRDCGLPLAANMAAARVDEWIEDNPRWSPVGWATDVLGPRLVAWVRHYDFLASGATEGFLVRYLASIARQRRHLERLIPGSLAGGGRVSALAAAVTVDIALARAGADHEKRLARSLAGLARALRTGVLDDGTVADRAPAVQARTLRDLIGLRGALLSADRQPPTALTAAIERLAPMLRFFRHGDGGLACFNGSSEGDAAAIDLILARAGGADEVPVEATNGGFQRLAAGDSLLIADTGAPTTGRLGGEAHAGTLSFEFSVGADRVVVNCGAYPGLAPEWRLSMRATAAHSTAVVDDTNSSDVSPHGGLEHPPRVVEARRFEQDGALWLETSHDGWRSLFGVVHRRRLWLAPDGTDIRGEDHLAGHNRKPVAKHASGAKFAVRFHLHPAVRVSLAHSGASALLRLPSGQGWRLRAAGATIGVTESVYLGSGERIRRAAQIVLTGALGPDGARVKWALTRVEG